jgi:F-type H+-transporting ATPase subunit a
MAFNLFSLVPGIGEEYEHVVTYSLVAVGLVGAGVSATASMKKQGAAAVIPDPKLSLRGLFEMITEFIQGFVDMVIGEHGRKYTPMFAAIFTFIFINNLVGVIPGMTPATEQINTTLAMGTFMFVTYNYLGFREHRHHYLKHFLGPLLWLAPLMVIIELISHIVRPLSLGLRLANVMGGDHTVVGIFTDLVPLILPIPFYLLGMFVCFVQAFVFTLLSMVYIALATAHDH